MQPTRRGFLAGAGLLTAHGAHSADAIVIDPAPVFEISPHLYMQFMEPLGTTDSSVEAAWDYDTDDWRKDFVAVVRDLSPDVIRWGGLFSRYYKWREGVGEPDKRPWMRNYVWGGKETNRVGTLEFVGLCRAVGAEPLYCVNFLGDGDARYQRTREGDRWGDAREAADWVSYCNDPDSSDRKSHGASEPLNVKLWQIGNETSYGRNGFSRDDAIVHTAEFALVMKQRDPSIRLIGWGDRSRVGEEGLWAGELLKRAGEHLDYVAIHLMGQSPRRPDTVLRGLRYQRAPERAWEELLELSNNVESRIAELEEVVKPYAPRIGIAVTEGHLGLSPHNAHPILAEWLSAVYHARSMNIYQRHGRYVRIATGADFEGVRWTVNAVMLQVPRGISYLMPAGSVMRLFKRHNGKHGVTVTSAPSDLDIAASLSEKRIYLHVANIALSRPVTASFSVQGRQITGGRVFEIAPDDPRQAVSQDQPDVFAPREKQIPAQAAAWTFPKASVSVVELDLG